MSDREFGGKYKCPAPLHAQIQANNYLNTTGNDDLSLPKGIIPRTAVSLSSYTVPYLLIQVPLALCAHNPIKRISSCAMYHRTTQKLISNPLMTATVQKIITEILPASSGQTFAKDARDLLIECCVEFITLISSEANDISEKEAKKTIACEHIEKALTDLGFGEYVPDVLAVAEEHREQLKVGSICLFLFYTLDLSIQQDIELDLLAKKNEKSFTY